MRAEAKELIAGFLRGLKQRGAELGDYKVDTTSDLARLMRVPGTTNIRYDIDSGGRAVKILDSDPDQDSLERSSLRANFDRDAMKRQAAEAKKRRAEFEAEQAKLAAERETAAKERARRDYPFSAESFEAAWPAIRAAIAAEEMMAARKRVADPRSYMNGLPGYSDPNNA